MSERSSYAQVLKSSSVMGGAAGINLLLGMVRVKYAAVLIGTAGAGLNVSFAALQSLIGTMAGLGIQSSAVREIAAAVGIGDQQAIGRAVLTLRRISWLTGLIGMSAMMLLSPLLSQITFGHREHSIDIAALGLVILFANLSGGQLALIQGMRRIGDMARANVIGAALGTVAAFGFYSSLGLRGIVPTLITVAVFQLLISWYYARKVPVPQVTLSIKQTLDEAGSMVRLGLVMMSSGLMGSAVTYITVILVGQQAGVNAVGLYSAAFALSGMFVNFVLGAMAADYYPRLTGVAMDKNAMNRMVNEQTEIGLLLAVPGLLATLALAPWLLQLFYTHEFLGATTLLQWFTLGCLGRVISWPLGFVMLAQGKGRLFLLTETISHLLHLLLIAIGLSIFGVEGVAIGFAIMYIFCTSAVYLVCRSLTDFAWSHECKRLILLIMLVFWVTFISSRNLDLWPATFAGLTLSILGSIICLQELSLRVEPDHRIMRILTMVPGIKFVFKSR